MALHTPGSFIHHRRSGLREPMWPAVVCTDDVATSSFLRNRPSGYVTLVLRVGEALDLCWALSSEMFDYDPSFPFEKRNMVESIPGLSEAYAVANSALEAGLGLEHWRDQVHSTVTLISSEDEDGDSMSEIRSRDTDEDFDEDLRMAIRLSRQECYGMQAHNYRPTPLSPSTKRKQHKVAKHPQKEDERNVEFSGTSLVVRGFSRCKNHTQTQSSSSDYKNYASRESTISFDHTENITRHSPREANRSSGFALNSKTSNLLSWGNLGKKSSNPTTDVVEGHLSASKDFVLIRVGLNRENRFLHKNTIWDRLYFRDLRSATNYFQLTDEGVWELIHPELVNIEPEEFNFVAEFLESNSFGYVHPQGDDERQEAFIQLTVASRAAEKLGMTDLLEHIAEKLERLGPWDLWNIICFACLTYAWPSPHLPAQDRLKEILVTEIAQHYWVCIEDEHLSAGFIQRLKDLPELERDVNVRRLAVLNAHLDSEEDEDNEEKEVEVVRNVNDNHNLDLYEC